MMMKVCTVIGLIQNYLNSHSTLCFPHKILHKHKFFNLFWDLRSSLHSKCMHANVKLWRENRDFCVFLFFYYSVAVQLKLLNT